MTVRVSAKYAALGGALGRRHKYNARRVQEDGYTFDSAAEHRRYCELKLLRSAGEIWQLEVHPRFPLEVNGVKIGTYELDFGYRATLNNIRGAHVVEDVKGAELDVWRLKARLFSALYPSIHFLVNGKRFEP